MAWLRPSLTLTFMFLVIVTLGARDTGHRGILVTMVGRFLRDYFVAPMTLPGALTFVFVMSAFCYALFPQDAGKRREP